MGNWKNALALKGSARSTAEKLDRHLRDKGASRLERNLLLGIAAVESAFDEAASGDKGKSRGLFQIERDNLPFEEQVRNGLAQARQFLDEQEKLGRAPVNKMVSQTVPDAMRLVRAQWQRGAKAAGAIQRWSEFLKNQVTVASGMTTVIAGEEADPVEVAMRGILGDDYTPEARLGVDQFIEWSGSEGSNTRALRKGRDAFNKFMDKWSWTPSSTLSGEVGSKGTGDTFKEAFDETVSLPAKGLAKAIRWGFETIREGGREFLKQGFTTIVPPALLVAGGYGLYRAIKAAFKGWRS